MTIDEKKNAVRGLHASASRAPAAAAGLRLASMQADAA